MREIKFRAWDGEKMRFVCRIDFDNPTFDLQLRCPTDSAPQHWTLSKIADTPLMQFTGLKDKHGNPIYEGDIIKQRGMKNTFVEYDKCKWVLRNDEERIEWRQDLATKISRHLEIIGNIHSNPELLK
jgi:uncharacterized phage protein (TIGR01671 family)